MFERFTDRSRRVVVLAQEEARMLNHEYVGTEHILLGLIREDGGVAGQALESLGITEEAARQQVGGGGRSEKIRTYNFPQNRLTDHRIGLTNHNLNMVMEGQLQPTIDALIAHDIAEKMKGEPVAA